MRRGHFGLGLVAAGLLSGLIPSAARADTRREQFPQVYTMTPMGVNLQTGTFMRSYTDFSVGSLSFVRSWLTTSSVGTNLSPLNDDQWFGMWNHNFGSGVRVQQTGDGLIATVIADGAKAKFQLAGSAWLPYDLDAQGALLTGGSAGGGNLVYRDRQGNVFSMNSSTQILQAAYADGTQIDYGYDGSKRLRTVLSNRGDAIVLDYGADGRLAAACGYNRSVTYVHAATTCAAAPVKVTYGYALWSGKRMLSSITDARGNVRTIQYDEWQNPNLKCITLPNSTTCEFVNTYHLNISYAQDIIATHTTATGEVWEFGASLEAMYDEAPYPGQQRPTSGSMTDPEGYLLGGDYNFGFLQEIVDQRTGRTRYEWDGSALKKVTYPEGNSEEMQRDGRQNVTVFTRRPKPGSNLAAIVWRAFYEQPPIGTGTVDCPTLPRTVCNKPIYTIDERSGRTDFTYDHAHGGVLTETGPIVNGVRPQTRYTYAQRYAWIKDAGGGYVQAASPVWLLVSKSFCKKGSASGSGCVLGPSDEVITTYDYGPDSGPNNLLLRGIVENSTGRALRTCYGYDWAGNRISETKPRAGLTSCP